MCVVGKNELAFLVGTGSDRTIALASIQEGRIKARLKGTQGFAINSMASSPDGLMIYYTSSGSVSAIPVSDGQPRRLRSGDVVTVDPYMQELIVGTRDKDGVRLIAVPLRGGPERAIRVEGEIEVYVGSDAGLTDFLSPSAVSKDGRILVMTASWFYPAGLLDPRTGRIETLRIGYDADMSSAGWTEDCKIVLRAAPLRSSLWRFRPVSDAQ